MAYKNFKNLLMASALVSLTACGGGGGGGGAIIKEAGGVAQSLSFVFSSPSLSGPASNNVPGGSSLTGQLQSKLLHIGSLSANVNVDSSTKNEATAALEFFRSWADVNSILESLKNSNRKSFDDIMRKEIEVDGKTYSFRDAHYIVQGAYNLLVPHQRLFQKASTGVLITTSDPDYKAYVNDSKINAYANLNESQIEYKLKQEGQSDVNVTKYNDNVVTSQLTATETKVASYINDINSFSSSVLSGSLVSSLSGLKPEDIDKQKARNVWEAVVQAETTWANVIANINSQSLADQKLIYASDDYKNAYAKYLFLVKHVKEVAILIKDGEAISTDQLKKLVDDTVITDLIQTEKSTTVKTDSDSKVSKLEAEILAQQPKVISTVDKTDTAVVTYGSAYDGDTTTTYTDYSAFSDWGNDEIVEFTTTSESDNGDNTKTVTTKTYNKTKQTRSRTREKTVTVEQFRTKTTTTKTYQLLTYSDGTTKEANITYPSTTDVETLESKVSTSTETATETRYSEPVLVSTTSNTVNKDTAYTDNDDTLGTKTPGYSTDKTTYENNEYKDRDSNGVLQGWANGGKTQIKASSAYSRGWTGKGVTIAVADTGYDTDHSEFQGQIVATKDYTGTGMNDTHGHGTHVLGSVVAKKDGNGTHGVAFDSKAVVIKITNSNYANTSLAADGFSWAADQGASVGNISANSNYDIYFRNGLIQMADGTYKSTDNRYDYSAGAFYNLQTPDEWIAATAKDLIVVNSAGNQGLAVPANPGYFATAVDGNGNLVLGGKMLIVGAVDQNNNIASWSNKAGHICQVIVDNSCTDTYKVSDFYILAPGWTYSTKNDGTYGTMAGTSMAAPYVTGGIALVRQMWPYMKGENVVRLLTTTANKNIRDYNVNIHGAGVMDLEKATRPVGATGIPTTGRTTSSVSTVSLSNSGGSGSSIAALSNSTALSSVMIVDEFARDFYVDLTKGITVQDKRKYSDVQVAQYGASYLPFQQQYGNYEQGGQFPIFMEGLEFGLYTDKDGNGDWSTNVTKKFKLSDKLSIKTTAGVMNEQDTWLGNFSDGALAVGKNNVTNFGQLGVEYSLGDNVFSFDVAQGYTDVNTKSNSLISSIDTLETQSLKLGYEKKVNESTKWGITYSIPNRITKGSTSLNVPYATTLNGEVVYDNVKTDMSATTPERDIGFYYSHQGKSETDWKTSFSIEYRQNVAGVAGDDKIVPALQVSKKFYGACMKLFGMMNKRPGCEKIRIEKKIKKLAKKKGTEDQIAALRYQLLGVEKQIAHINGDKQTVAKLDKEIALGWKQ